MVFSFLQRRQYAAVHLESTPVRAYEEWKMRGRTLAGCVEDEKMMIVVRYPSLSAPVCAPVGAQRPAPMIRSCGLMEIEHLIRYAPCAVGLMEIENL
jgi:hypothetical protein